MDSLTSTGESVDGETDWEYVEGEEEEEGDDWEYEGVEEEPEVPRREVFKKLFYLWSITYRSICLALFRCRVPTAAKQWPGRCPRTLSRRRKSWKAGSRSWGTGCFDLVGRNNEHALDINFRESKILVSLLEEHGVGEGIGGKRNLQEPNLNPRCWIDDIFVLF